MHVDDSLSEAENAVLSMLLNDISVVERRTKKQYLIGMIGLIGCGKTSVSNELAPLIGATIVRADDIRRKLKAASLPYTHVRRIALQMMQHIFREGGSVVYDSDCVDPLKRENINLLVTEEQVELRYLRLISDPEVMMQRSLQEEQDDREAKLVGLWQRTPLHYEWHFDGSGKWQLSELTVDLWKEIDTTNEKQWKEEVKGVVSELQ